LLSSNKNFVAIAEAVVSSMTAALDSTVSMGCSDVRENTYVLLLEWRCEGVCSTNKVGLSSTTK
jgi:hypothetical protein